MHRHGPAVHVRSIQGVESAHALCDEGWLPTTGPLRIAQRRRWGRSYTRTLTLPSAQVRDAHHASKWGWHRWVARLEDADEVEFEAFTRPPSCHCRLGVSVSRLFPRRSLPAWRSRGEEHPGLFEVGRSGTDTIWDLDNGPCSFRALCASRGVVTKST